MTIRIDGTNTAANPGITGADTDTGLQFGTDEVNVVTGGSTRATVDSSGRLGVGTTSPAAPLAVLSTSSTYQGMELITPASDGSGEFIFGVHQSGSTAGRNIVFKRGGSDGTASESCRIDASGRLLIGTTTPGPTAAEQLTIADSADAGLTIRSGTSSEGAILFEDDTADRGEISYDHSGDNMTFKTNGANRVRLGFSGVNYIWNNGNSTALIASSSVASSTTVVFAVRRSASSITGGTDAYYIRANGTAGSASDVNLKKNIETTRDGYLEDLNRLRVVKYNWNSQEDTEPRELGLIAQEVEEVFPGLVCDMNGEDENGEKTVHKGIVYSVLPVMLLKALQEADAKIEAQAAQIASQAATIAALDARLTALEGGAS